MPQELYITRMAEAGLLFGKPIYHGCTLWREYGLGLIDEMLGTLSGIVESCLGKTCVHLRHGMFNNAGFYQELYRSVNSYQNNFDITLRTGLFTIRSDTVESNMRQLLSSSNSCETVLSLTSIYRRGKGRSLFVDQCIFPTFSINCVSSKDTMEQGITAVKMCLDKFFDALLLPRLWICRPKGFESYGEFLLMPLMPESNAQLTVCSTVFVLSEPFRVLFNLDKRIFDVGFTSKLLAVYYIYQAAREHVILPSSVAPVQCMLLNEAVEQPDLIAHLEKEHIRFASIQVAERAKQRGSGRAMKMGVPMQVYRSHRGQLLIRRCFDGHVCQLSAPEDIKAQLTISDSLIRDHNEQAFEAVISKSVLVELSDESAEAYANRHRLDVAGQVYEGGPNSRRRFLFVPRVATGTIREKM